MNYSLNPSNPEQREILRRLFRVKQTEIEMIKSRGYIIDQVALMKTDINFIKPLRDISIFINPEFTFEDFLQYRETNNVFQNRIEFSCVYFNKLNVNETLLILYLNNEPGKQVGKTDLSIVYNFISSQAYKHIIIVTNTGLNPESNNQIVNRTVGYKIEVFQDYELAFNRTKHALAPISITHIPVANVSDWAKSENIQPEKLPMIFNVDMIAKWYGARPYDVFQYTIMGTTTDTAGYYRITRQTPVTRK